MIYLDNAATVLKKPDSVTEAVVQAMGTLGNSSRGVHGAALAAARTVYQAREAAACLFGCPGPERVVFTCNATEALNVALEGIFGPMLSGQEAVHLISTDLEHNSVLRPLYRLEDRGVRLSFVGADRKGNISYEEMEALIGPDTRGIICTHASNLTGNLLDLYRIGNIARSHGLYLIVDAAQTAGVFPIDMEAMGIDVLCFTGHKSLMGPQGTGGLCVGEGVTIRPLKVGGSGVHSYDRYHPSCLPEALEAGTGNAHGIAGLLAGISWITDTGMDQIRQRETELAFRFYERIRRIPRITVYGDWATSWRAPVVTVNLEGMDAGELADLLWTEYEIAVRAGAHCAPRMHRALGTDQTGAVRFSFSVFNTVEETDAAARALEEIARTDEGSPAL